jgi:signal transduction histidine kinase
MEGSPVRSHEKLPIVQLSSSHDLQSFHGEIVRLLGSEFKHAEILFGIVDSDSKTLQLPVWIKSHLERRPSLQKRLEQGEMVGISPAGETAMPRPAATVRSSVVLIPVTSEGKLTATIGLVSPLDGPQPSAEDIEVTRQLAYDAAPILSRLQEIETLRRKNQALLAKAERGYRAEEYRAALVDEKNMLDAILQMRSHQQVNIAHELRTPLAAIRGYTRMILDGRGGEINDTQREYLRIVTDNTNRLIALIGWMSYIAGLSAEQLKPTAFDFRDLWIDCANRNQDKLAEKRLKLTQQIAEEPFAIVGDREKLAYVLNELITVAARLADTGATITLDLSHGRERQLSFKLSEKGSSIPADVLSKIFDRPFNTVAKPLAQHMESGAINLSGVYDVVGMHGGRFFVNSTAGQGATFLFTLPAIMADEENSHEQAVNSGRRRR